MNKHTPGPWIAADTFLDNQPNRTFIRQKLYGGENVAYLGPSKGVNQANAQLIAAAPELLEALVRLLDCAQTLDQSATHLGIKNCDGIAQARSAIAKAQGKI